MISDTQIIKLKVYSDRWCPKTKRHIGYLWHYGHFIHDLVMPLNDWIIKNNIDPNNLTLYINDIPDQSIGQFTRHLEFIAGITVKQIPEEEFEPLPYETLNLKAYLFGPFSSTSFTNILASVNRRFDFVASENRPKVILIQRGQAKLGYDNNENIPCSAHATGTQRRRIENHAETTSFLIERYGDNFINVVLEDMEIIEQIKLFHHSHMIIAQHGAGLNNMIWMNSNDAIILEIGKGNAPPVFKNMCIGKGLIYRSIDEPSAVKQNEGNTGVSYRLNLTSLNTLLTDLENSNPKLALLKNPLV